LVPQIVLGGDCVKTTGSKMMILHSIVRRELTRGTDILVSNPIFETGQNLINGTYPVVISVIVNCNFLYEMKY
jgi:hypothetical protein